jgi:hypothetical protein
VKTCSLDEEEGNFNEEVTDSVMPSNYWRHGESGVSVNGINDLGALEITMRTDWVGAKDQVCALSKTFPELTFVSVSHDPMCSWEEAWAFFGGNHIPLMRNSNFDGFAEPEVAPP